MKIHIYLLFLFFISCNNLKNGDFITYYDDGNRKEFNRYLEGVKIDSSVFYRKDGSLSKIEIHSNKTSNKFQKNINKNNKIISEGFMKTNGNRIGEWNFNNKHTDSVVEYLNVNSTSVPNRIWTCNKKGDTIHYKSNYYKIYSNDTVVKDEVFRFRIVLVEPFYDYDSDIEVLLPTNDLELKKDYSNLRDIDYDFFYSLKNDGIPHPEIPKEVPQNQVVEFGLIYEEIGSYLIRGELTEYVALDSITTK
jgi:hypothetical protein